MIILYVIVGALAILSLGLYAMLLVLKSKKHKLGKSKRWKPCRLSPNLKARISTTLFLTATAQNKSFVHLMLLGQAKFAYNQRHE